MFSYFKQQNKQSDHASTQSHSHPHQPEAKLGNQCKKPQQQETIMVPSSFLKESLSPPSVQIENRAIGRYKESAEGTLQNSSEGPEDRNQGGQRQNQYQRRRVKEQQFLEVESNKQSDLSAQKKQLPEGGLSTNPNKAADINKGPQIPSNDQQHQRSSPEIHLRKATDKEHTQNPPLLVSTCSPMNSPNDYQQQITDSISPSQSWITNQQQKQWEERLLATKQQYNLLVERTTDVFQKARKISAFVGEFVTSINLFLESEQILVPLKEIQRGINDLNPAKVQKHINYLIKIFQTNFEEYYQKKMLERDQEWIQKIKDYQKINASIENQIKALKSNTVSSENKFLDHSLKLGEYQDIVKKLQQQKRELEKKFREQNVYHKNLVHDIEKEVEKSKGDNLRLKGSIEELKHQLKDAECRREKIQLRIRNKQKESLQMKETLKKMKENQSEVLEHIEEDSQRKIKLYEAKVEKYRQQKNTLEIALKEKDEHAASQALKIEKLQESIIDLKGEISSLKQKTASLKGQKQKSSTPNQKSRIQREDGSGNISEMEFEDEEATENEILESEKNHISKEVLRSLFQSYDDESKEWAVRRNIKKQILLLLGEDRTQKCQQPVVANKGADKEKQLSKDVQTDEKSNQSSFGKWLGGFF